MTAHFLSNEVTEIKLLFAPVTHVASSFHLQRQLEPVEARQLHALSFIDLQLAGVTQIQGVDSYSGASQLSHPRLCHFDLEC